MGEAKRRKQAKDPAWGQGTVQFKKLIHLGNSTHISPEELQSSEIKAILTGLVPGVSVSQLDLDCVFIGYLEKAGKGLIVPVMILDDPEPRIYARCRYQNGWGGRSNKDKERYVDMVIKEILEYTSDAQEDKKASREKGPLSSDAA